MLLSRDTSSSDYITAMLLRQGHEGRVFDVEIYYPRRGAHFIATARCWRWSRGAVAAIDRTRYRTRMLGRRGARRCRAASRRQEYALRDKMAAGEVTIS